MQHILQDLLPSDLKLLMDAGTRILSLFDIEKGEIVVQKRLTRNEWTLLMVFEKNHPRYAPNELLLASLTSLSPDMCRKRLHEAQEKSQKTVNQELKPVYRALTGLRKKLKSVYPQLDISLLRGVGYVLRVARDISEEAV